MILKYSFFVLAILFILAMLNVFFTPINLSIDGKYSKYNLMFKKIYSDYVWTKFKTNMSQESKFEIIKNVLDYNSEFKEAELELCSNIDSYLVSSIKTSDLANILKLAFNKNKTQEFATCYLKSLESMSEFDNAISFLKEEEQNAKDPYIKNYYFEKIKEIADNKNIFLLRAVLEKYYSDKKKYPQELSILKDLSYLEAIPEDPYGGQYYLGEKGSIRRTSERR